MTEAASVNIASPVFLESSELRNPVGGSATEPSNQFIKPWDGGWWRRGDIIEYQMAFARSLLGSINREPQFWLSNAVAAAQRSIDAGLSGTPRGWLIPADTPDPAAAKQLIDLLIASGVEVRVASEEILVDGRRYDAGTIVIDRAQPYGGYVKDLFEVQRYPAGSRPYDVAGWTLPLLMGVRRVEVTGELTGASEVVESADQAVAALVGDRRLADAPPGTLSTRHSDDWTKLVADLQAEQPYHLVLDGPMEGLLVPGDGSELQSRTLTLKRMPRIGLYAPWSASIDEGWLRWVLDEFKIPFQTVRNETLRAGQIGDQLDVLILPDVSSRSLDRGRAVGTAPQELTGGLDPEGAIAVEAFVRDGGRLLAIADAANWAIELFQLPLVDVTREDSAEDFSCPGSILRGVTQTSPWTVGLPDDLPLYFAGSAGYREMTEEEREDQRRDEREIVSLIRYAPTRLLMSGYIDEPEVLHGRDAWVTTRHGRGRVHLFGFRPHYRAWSRETFEVLFRAALLN